MLTLKQAIKEGKLEQFIKEREGMVGDQEAFDKAISLLAKENSPEVPKTSSQDDHGN